MPGFRRQPELKTIKRTPNENDELEEDIASPAFATVHTARRVPVYRKLGPFQTKRLRESVIHSTLDKLDRETVTDPLPAELRDRHKLISRRGPRQIHFFRPRVRPYFPSTGCFGVRRIGG